MIIPIILCGGSGTRLWPLSRKSFPKQFVSLIDNKSLLHLTLERLGKINEVAASKLICIAAEDHRFLVAEAMQAANAGEKIILEPVARNTAAAMALAALQAKADELLLFCPADHHIPDTNAFLRVIEQGRRAAESGAIVTFGVMPSFPSTAYGYIECDKANEDGGGYKVVRFIEKPNTEKAQALILQGKVLWNAGIFLTRADTLIQALQEYAPDILQNCQKAMASATKDEHGSRIFVRPEKSAFTTCRSQSIDYAVMEHHPNLVVVPFNGAWSDVGSWNAVAELVEPDGDGNRIEGHGLAVQARRTFIHAPYRPVVALGTEELLIIDTADALLVAARTHAEDVKHVVTELETRQSPQATLHRKVARPWGWYDSIDMGERFQVKRIAVKPGASLSLQKHYHRAEHWIVVKGTAEVTCGNSTYLLSENQSTYIPIGEVHRLHNPGKTDLEMIEVQSGSYLGEDDIVRFEDTYGRVQ
ncbi:mannose-1-phosphate guanylyltransferase/mannose-6-phosphate isomerase [Noviherbaspirillum autotrophicum]|uniref:mannose-1-phosphate guanylyltransferase n=1 Tax=Noviherbaspirillum autotrophicum TaxID=709839 RepID=A0A0C2BRM6_9BURK|nr:mannose-1-phosphate guanylyltransferase/mannose-6-phosphate isomerase [Noviherbaspirillum autotrophicum]KIF82729.1 mannose-1-phosphate guanyltransferase [Noviherbaspirillum autotrophicum]KIF84179.1 mannose-1-phosphate guanyltransferase [Noviherbaspirillum autotrophicum]